MFPFLAPLPGLASVNNNAHLSFPLYPLQPFTALIEEKSESLVRQPAQGVRRHERQHPRSQSPGETFEALLLLDDADCLKHTVGVANLRIR